MQFREICLLQCSTIINTFWVDPHSELLKKVPVKPKNSPVNIQTLTKIIEQHDVTRTHSCKPGYLNLSIVSLQMYNSTILEQKLNDIPDRNNQNVFETSFASVFC